MRFEQPLCLALLCVCTSVATAQTTPAWEERHYNPKPAEGDITLPLPCNGSIVFRKVVVPASGPLDDLAITIGQETDTFAFVEQRRPAHIAGSFTEPDKANPTRYYLIGKYELTALQYKALSTLDTASGAECPAPARSAQIPITNLNWFDAMRLGHLYNIWLRQQHPDALPKEDGITGFVRLPTEVEWEFAARGGVNVDGAAFAETRYPMPEGINDYEWFGGAQSSNNKIQLAGLLKPNPLGLHDMLGNVAEMTLDAFRLNKFDRQHGGTGAYVIRGGDFRKPEAGLRSAARREGNHYNATGAQTENTVGLRWVIAAPELTSRQRIEELETGWQALGSGHVSTDAADRGRSAVQELGDLAGRIEDQGLKDQLQELENKLRASNLQQEEARDQAIRASLNLGAFLCTKLRDDGRYVEHIRKTYTDFCEGSEAAEECTGYKRNLDNREYELAATAQYYASSLVDAATLYGQANIARQVPFVETMLAQNQKLTGLTPYLNTYWAHQQAYLQSWKVDRDPWLSSCMAVVKP